MIEILDEGSAIEFSKITPNEFREHMRQKGKNALRDKRMSLKDSIKKFVHDGDYITLGGVSYVRLPMTAVREIIRQGKRNLNMAAGTRTYDLNLLLEAGSVKNLDIGYITGMEVFGIPYFTRKKLEKMISNAELGMSEYDNASMAWRHKAAAMGLPFLPVRNLMGADSIKHNRAKIIRCPFTSEKIAIVPALYADVCIIHVHRCDKYGNCQIEGALNEDIAKSRSAKALIITTEKIIDTDEIRQSPHNTTIPFLYVDAVIEAPYGAHPSNMPGMYYLDIDHIREYMKAARDISGNALAQYHQKYILGIDCFEDYLRAIGGKKKLKYLEDVEHMRIRTRKPA